MQRPPGAFAKYVWPLCVRQDSKSPECAWLLAVSERRFMKMLPPRNNGGRERPQRQRLETLRSIVSCAVCPPASFYARIPRRRPRGAGRSRIHAQVAPPRERERAEALLHVHRPDGVYVRAQGVFAPENPAFLSKNRFFAVSAPQIRGISAKTRSDCPKIPVFTV